MSQIVDQVYSYVASGIAEADARANNLLNRFETTATRLATVPLPTLPPLPEFADPGAQTPSGLTVPAAPSRPQTTTSNLNLPQDPADILAEVNSEIDAIVAALPTFSPSITSLAVPNAPAAIDVSGVPSRPFVDTSVAFPVQPELTLPVMGQFVPVTVPAFTFPVLPEFTESAPVLGATPPSAVLAWGEPEYASEQLDGIQAAIARMLAGQSGLPAAVEAALFDRARGRDDIAGLKAVQEAHDVFAAKGYSMPPGMLAKQVNAVIEDNQLKANATGREIYIRANEVLITQLNQAVEKGIALEQLQQNLFNNIMQRRFEIEKFRLEQAISIYNAEVQAFNIRSQAYNVAAQVYKTRLDGALARIEAFKTEVEAQQAISALNEQTVKVFQAELQGVQTKADIYRTSMEAARIQLDAAKTQIDLYKSDIEAYATRVQADKTRFEAYAVQVQGEGQKANILEAESRAYAARVQAVATGGGLALQKVNAKVAASQQATQRYIAQVSAERDRVTAQAQVFSNTVEMYRADIQGYTAQFASNVSARELDIKSIEASLRNAIARYDAELKKYDGESTRSIKLAELNLESLRAMSQYAAQLAAGAMSAVNLGMSMQGSGQGSESFNNNTNTNINLS
jgi:hypothetical protein